jgi:hypothetical protein
LNSDSSGRVRKVMVSSRRRQLSYGRGGDDADDNDDDDNDEDEDEDGVGRVVIQARTTYGCMNQESRPVVPTEKTHMVPASTARAAGAMASLPSSTSSGAEEKASRQLPSEKRLT